MVAILYQPNYGVPGDITRPNAPYNDETQAFNPATPFPGFGLPGKLSGGYFVPITTTGDAVYGFLTRVYPSAGPSNDPFGSGVPPTAGPCSVLKKGYIAVQNNSGVPAQGGAVYIRFQNASAGKPVGGVEAAATGDTYAATGWTFTGAADASGNVEITNL